MPTLSLRLDAEAHKALTTYAEEKGINLSAAARIILAIGYEKISAVDQIAHGRAVREGVSIGRAAFTRALQTALREFEGSDAPVVEPSKEGVQPGLSGSTKDERSVVVCGDCYRFAAQWKAPSDQESVVVVHGMAQEPLSKNTKRFPHAWVEWHGKAFDWQTQATKPDGIPLEMFYELWKAEPKKRYTSDEAKALAVRNKHWGPW